MNNLGLFMIALSIGAIVMIGVILLGIGFWQMLCYSYGGRETRERMDKRGWLGTPAGERDYKNGGWKPDSEFGDFSDGF